MSEPLHNTPAGTPRKTRGVAIAVVVVTGLMLGLSYASVPLYRMFCAATGYGGTTQVARVAPETRGKRQLQVRFDANVAPGLNWKFEPETPTLMIRTGETATVFFKVTNMNDKPSAATAMFNVGPDIAGAYFNKISCFCFDEQKLDARETMDMPVVFFLDPALEKDETMNGVDSMTLSYTFFGSKTPSPVASNVGAGAKEKPKL